MSKRKEIFKQTGIYAAGSQLSQLIGMVAAILSRRFLGPTQMGIWATIQIVVEYSKYSTMGTLHGVAREIPYYIGKGKPEVAEEIKNVVFTSILVSSSLIGFVIFLFALITKGRFSVEVRYGLFFVSVVIVLQRLNDLFVGLLRCYKKFTLASMQMVWSAAVNAVLVAFLTYFFKIYGFICALVFSFIFNLVYIHLHNNFHFRLQLNFDRFRALVIFGFPLMMISVMTTILKSVDRLVIVKALGFEALGFYTIALMVGGYITNFINSFAIVYIPHLQERAGMSDNLQHVRQFLLKSSSVYTLIMPGIIGCAWTAIPYCVALVLPKYIPGILAMKMFSLGIFFLALNQTYQDFLVAVKKHHALLPLLGISSVLSIIVDLGAVRMGFGIEGVAFGTSLIALLNFSVTYFLAAKQLASLQEAVKRYLSYLGYGAYFMLILFLLDRAVPSNIHSFGWAALKTILFLFFYSPLFIRFNQNFSFLKLLRELISTRFNRYFSREKIGA